MQKRNRLVEAWKESYNTIGLASAVALSVAFLNPVPLLTAIVMEAAYLLFVPDSRWYEVRLARRYDAEIEQRRQDLKKQTLPLLRIELQQQFERLEAMRLQIDAQSQEDKAWYREVLRKLDYLLEKFLLFASKEAQFRTYLEQLYDDLRHALPSESASGSSQRRFQERDRQGRDRQEGMRQRPTSPAAYDAGMTLSGEQWTGQMVQEIQAHYTQEGEKLRQAFEVEADEATRSILHKRIDILQRRAEFVEKIGRILLNINHQLQLVEDTFGLINDEIRARSPEQILAEVEEVVIATDTMATSLQELASVEQMLGRIA